MIRRKFIAGVATFGAIALSGCTQPIHRLRGVDTPVTITIATEGPATVSILVERDGTSVFDGTATFDEERNIDIDGDDYRDAAFETAGKYTITAETTEQREQNTYNITWRDLADCNHRRFSIRIEDGNPEIGRFRTDAGCGLIDKL